MAVLVSWFVTLDFLSRHVPRRVQFLKKKKVQVNCNLSSKSTTHMYAIYDFLP